MGGAQRAHSSGGSGGRHLRVVVFACFFTGLVSHPPSDALTVCFFSTFKAWLTEIHEYAQKDVVIMLLGNKVSEASSFIFYFFALHKKMRRITGPSVQF